MNAESARMRIGAHARKFFNSSLFRFLVAGGSTTLLSYIVYLALLDRLGTQFAYALAFVIGVIWSYSANTWYVFRQPWSLRKLSQFPLVYAVQYVISASLLELLVNAVGVPAPVAPLIVVVLTLPITYLLARFAVVGRATVSDEKKP